MTTKSNKRQKRETEKHSTSVEEAVIMVVVEEDASHGAAIIRKSAVSDNTWKFLISGVAQSLEDEGVPMELEPWYESAIKSDKDAVHHNACESGSSIIVPDDVKIMRVRLFYGFN